MLKKIFTFKSYFIFLDLFISVYVSEFIANIVGQTEFLITHLSKPSMENL